VLQRHCIQQVVALQFGHTIQQFVPVGQSLHVLLFYITRGVTVNFISKIWHRVPTGRDKHRWKRTHRSIFLECEAY
jgi:hypothetical protein